MKVSPSVLATRLTQLSQIVKQLDEQTTNLLHMDIMDGHFVPPLTFGESFCQMLNEETNIPLDIHLMVSQPHREVPKYFSMQPYNITFHYEASDFPIRLLQEIRSHNIKAGIALNPKTPVAMLEELFPYLDLVLLMTVEPGYYGQAFLENGFERIAQFQKMRERYDHKVELQVDGGINETNIQKLASLGVDIVVAGSFIFQSENPNQKILQLKDVHV